MPLIVVGIPLAARVSQNAFPFRSSSTRPPVSGRIQLPIRIVFCEGSALLVDRYGVNVAGSRWIKSKMPWPPGSIPVIKFDQATGLRGGTLVASFRKSPCAFSRVKLGSFPCSIRRSTIRGSRPSIPRTSTRFPPVWVGPLRQEVTTEGAMRKPVPAMRKRRREIASQRVRSREEVPLAMVLRSTCRITVASYRE